MSQPTPKYTRYARTPEPGTGSRYIVGIDPGTTESGWCIYDTWQARVAHSGKTGNETVLSILSDLAVDEERRPYLVVIERFQSMGFTIGQTTIDAIEWGGRFREAARVLQLNCTRLFRCDVKLILCGQRTAKDKNIRQRIIDLHDPSGRNGKGEPSAIGTKANPGPLYGVSGDAWSAISVVLAALMDREGVAQ